MVKLISGGQQYHQQITTIHTHQQNIVVAKVVSYGQTHAEPAPPTPKMCYICIGQLKFRRNIR